MLSSITRHPTKLKVQIYFRKKEMSTKFNSSDAVVCLNRRFMVKDLTE